MLNKPTCTERFDAHFPTTDSGEPMP